MKEILGRPPVLSLRGCHADIDSSRSFITDAATVLALFLLKALINIENMNHGSWLGRLESDFSKSAKACGK
jgi:hypothetical protein